MGVTYTTAAGATYIPIASYTVSGTSTTSYNFSSITSAYTDLILIIQGSASAADNVYLRFNSDSTTNYSCTGLFGNGTSATSSSRTSFNAALIFDGGFSTTQATSISHIMNYANTTTYKTVLTRNSDTATYASAEVCLWRATPAAISTVTVGLYSGAYFVSGTTFSLYGILGA